jgi:hypothetical protein
MTPTATKTKAKPTATERERELEAALAEAKAEITATEQRRHEHRTQVRERTSALQDRLTAHPGEFSATGTPKPRTPAAKIADEIKRLVSEDSFDAMVVAAQRRAEGVEDELRRHRAEAVHDLLIELEPEAREAVEGWLTWASQGEAHYRKLVDVAARSTRLAVQTRLYRDRRVVPDYEHQALVLKQAAQPPPLPLPSTFVVERQAEQMDEEGN